MRISAVRPIAAARDSWGFLYHTAYEEGAWTKPRLLLLFPDAPDAWAADMSVSPDGQRLYFMGAHPIGEDRNRSDLNIWVSRRVDGAWSTAEPIPFPVNTEANEVYSSVVADGSWGEPRNLGPNVNSERLDYCPMVTPDGKYLFFSRRSSEPSDGGWARVVSGDVYWVDAAVIMRLRPDNDVATGK